MKKTKTPKAEPNVRYKIVTTADNRQRRVVDDDGLPRTSKYDIQRLCNEIIKKPDGFNFVGSTPDYPLVARCLHIDPIPLQAMYVRGQDPHADPDDRWAYTQISAACAIVERAMVHEWRAGNQGARTLLEAYLRKYCKSFREHMEVEIMNMLNTLREVADDATFLRFLDTMRSQDKGTQALAAYTQLHGLSAGIEDDDVIDAEFEDVID